MSQNGYNTTVRYPAGGDGNTSSPLSGRVWPWTPKLCGVLPYDLWKYRARSVLKAITLGWYGRLRVVGRHAGGGAVYQRINWQGRYVSWCEPSR